MTKDSAVYVLEDHPETRLQLCNTIDQHDRLTLVGQGSTLEEAYQYFFRSGFSANAVLVDLELPDGNSTNLIRELNELLPKPKIVVITVFGDEKRVVSAVEAGAIGYLMKEDRDKTIAEWVCRVLDGECPISPSIAHHILSKFANVTMHTDELFTKSKLPLLTPRECDVLQLSANGFRDKEIARELGIEATTVTSHVKNIYGKLEVHSRTAALIKAREIMETVLISV